MLGRSVTGEIYEAPGRKRFLGTVIRVTKITGYAIPEESLRDDDVQGVLQLRGPNLVRPGVESGSVDHRRPQNGKRLVSDVLARRESHFLPEQKNRSW